LPAGKALALGLHVYNPSTEPLSGTSGIEIVRAKPEDVHSEADLMLAGPISFSLPPGKETTITGTCKISSDQTVFTLFPHMHQLGTHLKTTITVDGAESVLHDADYFFEEQYELPVGPIAFHTGDTVTTDCTYNNTTSRSVTFGESSDTEMCFSILYHYPAQGTLFCR